VPAAKPFRAMRGLPALLMACLAAILPACVSAAASPACLSDAPCRVDARFYVAQPPPGWDGASALPTLVFHGFRGFASDVMAREDVRAFAEAGLLLVVPQGEGQSWSHPATRKMQDEIAFVNISPTPKRRWRFDAALSAYGFSQGASMVWNIACYRGNRSRHIFR